MKTSFLKFGLWLSLLLCVGIVSCNKQEDELEKKKIEEIIPPKENDDANTKSDGNTNDENKEEPPVITPFLQAEKQSVSLEADSGVTATFQVIVSKGLVFSIEQLPEWLAYEISQERTALQDDKESSVATLKTKSANTTSQPRQATIFLKAEEVDDVQVVVNQKNKIVLPVTGKEKIFMLNVSESKGWHALNQGSTNYCWAYSSAALISWWANVVKDKVTAQNYPNNLSEANDIAWNFRRAYENQGGYVYHALRWWLVGIESWAYFPARKADYNKYGGYYKHVQEIENLITEFRKPFNNSGIDVKQRPFEMSKFIYEAIKNGGGIALSTPNHAISAWGVTMDFEKGLITEIWVTDSSGIFADKTKLQRLEVEVDTENNRLALKRPNRDGYAGYEAIAQAWIDDVTAISTNL